MFLVTSQKKRAILLQECIDLQEWLFPLGDNGKGELDSNIHAAHKFLTIRVYQFRWL